MSSTTLKKRISGNQIFMRKIKLYIGIEVKVREFDAKLLLSCAAAEAGYEVILGQQRQFKRRLEEMPKGIYFDKSVTANKVGRYIRLGKLGFQIVAFDEEGLAFIHADEYQKRRVALKAFEHVDLFFAWGDRHAGVITEKIPGLNGSIIPAGHPRLDLIRKEFRGFYDDEVVKLREQYGNFILINTNFSWCNHVRGENALVNMLEKAGKIVDDKQRQYYSRIQVHKKQLLEEFTTMVAEIRHRFPNMSIVLRPHPTENLEYWNTILPQDKKLFIVREGNVVPWLMAAEVVIHNSCSTGIEAYLLDKPVISYQPNHNKEFDLNLQNDLSRQAFTLTELLGMLDQHLKGGWQLQDEEIRQKHQLAGYYIASIDGPFSCDRVVTNLRKMSLPDNSLQISAFRLYKKIRRLGGKVIRGNRKHMLSQTAYDLQKFPGIELDEMQQAISTFQRLTGRFSNIRVEQLEKNMFQIVG